MVQGGMDRRIAGIIRWLERFQSSYRSGAIESALMDAECARADLEDLRSDVWRSVGAARTAASAARSSPGWPRWCSSPCWPFRPPCRGRKG